MNWLFYLSYSFVVYSFLGWCLEEIYSFVTTGFFRKDNFFIGPFKPMYGFAAVALLFSYEYLGITGLPITILFFSIPTLIEFITGYLLLRLFNKRYWSYDNNRFNFKGIICLKFSVYWSIISAIIVYLIHPYIEGFYFRYVYIMDKVSFMAIIYMIIDLYITVKVLCNKKTLNQSRIVN